MNKETFDIITWTTSGARFAASKRLSKQNRLALYGAAMLSLASTLLATSHLPWASYAASVTSAFALVFSLIEASGEHGIKSERLHQCAVKIRELMYQAKAENADMAALSEQYYRVIAECPENHQAIDVNLIKAQAVGDNHFSVRYALCSYGLYWSVITLALVLIASGR